MNMWRATEGGWGTTTMSIGEIIGCLFFSGLFECNKKFLVDGSIKLLFLVQSLVFVILVEFVFLEFTLLCSMEIWKTFRLFALTSLLFFRYYSTSFLYKFSRNFFSYLVSFKDFRSLRFCVKSTNKKTQEKEKQTRTHTLRSFMDWKN